MNLLQAQKIVAYVTLVVAVGALSIAGVIGPVGIVLVPLAVVVSWFWEPGRRAVERQRTFWNIVLLGFIGLTGWQVLAGGAPVLGPAVDLVLVLVVAKLFQRASARDYTQIYALTFLMMAVATVLDDGLHFGALLALYLICCAAGFSINQVVRQSEESRTPARNIRVPGRYLALLGAMSVALVGLSALFFLILPRVGIGMGKSDADSPTRMTGFSESIDLSEHGALGLDRTVVLRAETNRRPGSLYWRGVSFDRFDGQRWSISPELRRRRGLPVDAQGRFAVARALDEPARDFAVASPAPALLRQSIELEPLDAEVLLGLPHVVSITYARDAASSQRWHNASIDRTGSLFHGFGAHQRVHYVVESLEAQDDVSELRYDPSAPLPPQVARYYLSAPRVSSRVRRLAVELAHGVDNPVEIAQRIERHLATRYAYTLELPRRGDDPIDNFLFEDPRGHCEFFSTAMVLMLRSVGVPARNVNGFQGGDYNELGNYWIVRRLNAHSWVEVWIPGEGWVTFDPTPEAGLPSQRTPAEAGMFGPLDSWLDQMRRLWRGWVLDYDLRNQLDLLGGLDERGELSAGSVLSGVVEGLLEHWWRWLVLLAWLGLTGVVLWRTRRGALGVVAFGVAGGLGLALTLWPRPSLLAVVMALATPLWLAWRLRVLGASLRTRQAAVAAPPLARVYLRVVQALARLPGQDDAARLPPEALAARLAGRGGELDQRVAAFVRRYARVRFGPGPRDAASLRELRREAARLRTALRRERRAALAR